MTRTDSNATPRDALVLHPHDNVATALRDLQAGHHIHTGSGHERETLVLREAVAMCHKFALHDIASGAVISKYGEAIGQASRAIAAGEHVHTHNLRSARGQTSGSRQS